MQIADKGNRVVMWFDQLIEEMTREELIEVVNELAGMMEEMRVERNRWRDAADPLKYLLAEKRAE